MEIKRLLIENDGEIDTNYCGQYEWFMERYDLQSDLSDFFDTIVVDASENKESVIAGILSHNEIWIDSSYVGESGSLLVDMLQFALDKGIRDKTLINMRGWTDCMWHMPYEARPLIKSLEMNNIKFIYKDGDDYDSYLPQMEYLHSWPEKKYLGIFARIDPQAGMPPATVRKGIKETDSKSWSHEFGKDSDGVEHNVYLMSRGGQRVIVLPKINKNYGR